MRHQRISQEESFLCRCSMIFPVDHKKRKRLSGKGQWSIDNVTERKLNEFAESGCPIFRATNSEKLKCSENLCISSWSYDMEGHTKKCVERHCELANKTTQQLYKVSTPCIDDYHFKEE